MQLFESFGICYSAHEKSRKFNRLLTRRVVVRVTLGHEAMLQIEEIFLFYKKKTI